MSQQHRIDAIKRKAKKEQGLKIKTPGSSFYAPLDPKLVSALPQEAVGLDEYVKGFLSEDKQMEAILKEKVTGRSIVLDNTSAANINRCGERSKPKNYRISNREAKRKGIFALSPDDCKFATFVALNSLWMRYMEDLMCGENITGQVTKLLKADLHGALVKVTKTKCPSYLGVTGIIIQETTQTFKVITAQDKLVVLPKRGSIFTFLFHNEAITIYGNNIISGSAERSKKRYKIKKTIGL
eukprot:TRINITY_DN10124_c0_g1_i1.p1 TRINITY_DN10124_c0_g1~~TRINITY_DN10124_c0_g1_i1.p1  ORF type:complete len:240 (+),score=43.32 TRINITY_DN10124_c0_g1_i1:56-775(+)